jgi:hypothetical protein
LNLLGRKFLFCNSIFTFEPLPNVEDIYFPSPFIIFSEMVVIFLITSPPVLQYSLALLIYQGVFHRFSSYTEGRIF